MKQTNNQTNKPAYKQILTIQTNKRKKKIIYIEDFYSVVTAAHYWAPGRDPCNCKGYNAVLAIPFLINNLVKVFIDAFCSMDRFTVSSSIILLY